MAARRLGAPLLAASLAASGCGRDATRVATAANAASHDTSVAAELTRLPLDSGGSWDHVVAGASPHRLYVSHESHVDVLDLDRDSVVGRIRDTPDVHGVVLAPELGRGYTSDGGDSTLAVFDPATLAVSHRIRLAADGPDGVAYDPATRRIFAMHGNLPSLSVIQAGPDTIVATVPLGGSPDGGVADGRGRMYVALKDRSELAVLDARRLVVERRWPLAPCVGPDAIAIDATRSELLLGCDNGVAIAVATRTGAVTSTFPIGAGVDGIVAIGDGRVLVSTGAGGIALAQRDGGGRYRVLGTMPTPRGSRTSAWDATRGRLMLPTARLGTDPRVDSIGRGDGAPRTGFAVLVVDSARLARR